MENSPPQSIFIFIENQIDNLVDLSLIKPELKDDLRNVLNLTLTSDNNLDLANNIRDNFIKIHDECEDENYEIILRHFLDILIENSKERLNLAEKIHLFKYLINFKDVNKKELKIFKGLLLKKREEVGEGIEHVSADTLKKSQKEAAGDISAYTYHMADVATDTYDREFSLSLGSSEREMLYEVNEALKRIEDATYGICESCLKLIAKTRLKAVPHAKLCLKCKKAQEESRK